MKMTFKELPEFSKEFKRFAKKYKSLPEDLEEFKRVVYVIPLGNSKQRFRVLTKNDLCAVIKARLSCRYLKGSDLRIIYAFYHQNHAVDFIELYFKGDKENHDVDRVRKYWLFA
ncbi:MAG: hypothetical protein KKC21_01555 [Nitrospinae bacterium]|nr:hypothetical protein [Nitrospinota bacterium]